MNDLDLDAIEARANAATKGPWCFTVIGECDGNLCIRGEHWDVYRTRTTTDITRQEPGIVEAKVQVDEVNVACVLCDDEPTVRFIVHARTDVPALVTEVRQLRQQLADLTHEIRVVREQRNEWARQYDTASLAEERRWLAEGSLRIAREQLANITERDESRQRAIDELIAADSSLREQLADITRKYEQAKVQLNTEMIAHRQTQECVDRFTAQGMLLTSERDGLRVTLADLTPLARLGLFVTDYDDFHSDLFVEAEHKAYALGIKEFDAASNEVDTESTTRARAVLKADATSAPLPEDFRKAASEFSDRLNEGVLKEGE